MIYSFGKSNQPSFLWDIRRIMVGRNMGESASSL